MSKIALNSNASGTGVFTIASPNSDTDRTLTLPDESGDFVLSSSGVISDFTSTGIDDNATSTAITIDASENVGIGTSSITTFGGYKTLHFKNNSGNAINLAESDGGVIAQTICDDSTGVTIGSRSNHILRITTNDAEAMRIDSSGNLMIGTIAFNADAEGLALNSFAVNQSSGALLIHSVDQPLELARTFGDNASRHQVQFYREGAQVGLITCTNTSTAYNTSSDYRLKENVVDLTGATDRLNQILVHRFNFIADPDTTVDGFLAHEVADVVPEAIFGTKDEVDDEGNPVYQGIDQSKLVPLLTAALQEAVAKIEDLESRLSALETN